MTAPEAARPNLSAAERRNLASRLSYILEMPPQLALTLESDHTVRQARRLGFTGPPGAGKSTLVDAWSRMMLDSARRVAVLAVDPSSPLSSGSVLGDRIRLDRSAGHPAFYMRSLPSRRLDDGLCPNAALMLDALDEAGFDEVLLETVGVGQAEHAARALVDILVLVLDPEGGDIVQAMKAGIVEIADIIVINKADQPAATRKQREIQTVLALRGQRDDCVPVLAVSALEGTGLAELHAAVERCTRSVTDQDMLRRARERQRHRIMSGLRQIADRELAGLLAQGVEMKTADLWRELLSLMLTRYSDTPP